jgi:hypothetical protein
LLQLAKYFDKLPWELPLLIENIAMGYGKMIFNLNDGTRILFINGIY